MQIASLFKQKKTVLSFEVFPPKKTSPIETIYETLDQLKDLKPDLSTLQSVRSMILLNTEWTASIYIR